jgi:RimJ/RimL family protein N-acetyltransferase
MDYKIKSATYKDLDAIHEYLNYFFSLKIEGISLRPNGITKEETKQYLPETSINKDKLCLIALKDQAVVGCLTFSRHKKIEYQHCGEFGMTVHPEFWNKGIGTGLMNELEAWCLKNSFLKIELGVWSNNITAIRLYEKYNYKVEGVRKKSIIRNDNAYDLILMGKWIG